MRIQTSYDEDRLLYGYCPKDHCFSNQSTRLMINSETNRLQLDDQYICHRTRTGRLCSQCRDNYTAHYHSNSYKCGSKSTCKWGWLLYLIAELLPVTCLFLMIILLDVKLTSGVVNGLIYFAQTIDKIVLHDASYYFGTSKFTTTLIDAYAVTVRILNLNFIQLDKTSYCLWENAQTLDMIAFRYVTTIYTLFLVIAIIVAAHYCNRRYYKGVLSKIKRPTARSTLIHGITGFLILSYSEVTSTSVNLLLSMSLYSKGHNRKYTAVYYNGELTNMRGRHLFYAIPAIFILSTLGLIPPLLLITYPLCYKVLALMKLNESKFSRLLCIYVPLEKMKPLFDSFQSSFKDEYRFFSGLYFVFRLSTLAIQAIPAADNTTYFYAAISIQSVSICLLHAICQPYKNKWHNILEGIFLFDIAVIAMTLSTVNIHTHHTHNASNTGIITFQLVLLYLPLLIMLVYAGIAVWKKLKSIKCFKMNSRGGGESFEYHEFRDSIIFNAAENRVSPASSASNKTL